MSTIGTRLSKIRREVLNMSQAEFSTILGISQGALSEIEKDKRGLTQEAIISMIHFSYEDSRFPFEYILTGHIRVSIDQDSREILDLLNMFSGRERVKFIARCEDAAKSQLQEIQEIQGKKHTLSDPPNTEFSLEIIA